MKIQNAFNDFYNEFKDWTKEEILQRTFDIILESSDKDRQLEAYENMRKEAIEYAKNSIDLLKPPCVSTINEEEYARYIIIHDNYLNILNKIGDSDE